MTQQFGNYGPSATNSILDGLNSITNPGTGFPTAMGISTSGMNPYDASVLGLMQRGFDQKIMQDDRMYQLAQESLPTAFQKGAQMFGNISQGIAGLGSIYLGSQGMKLQKQAFAHNRDVANTNLNNSIQDYNRRLSDTLANRALNNGQGEGWVSEQLSKYSAKRG